MAAEPSIGNDVDVLSPQLEEFKQIRDQIQAGTGWAASAAGWECLVDTTIKKDVVKAWRMPDPASGLYKFRVFGVRIWRLARILGSSTLQVLSNIELEAFFEFYSDYAYRATWDAYTASLSVVDSVKEADSSIQVDSLLWRVKFGVPLVSDREYLFTRSARKVECTWVILDRHLISEKWPEKKSVVC